MAISKKSEEVVPKAPTQRAMHLATEARIKETWAKIATIPAEGSMDPAKRAEYIASVEQDILRMAKVVKANKKAASEQEAVFNECFDRSAMFGADLFPNLTRLRKPKTPGEAKAIEDDPLDF
jgi:hypothetical protein